MGVRIAPPGSDGYLESGGVRIGGGGVFPPKEVERGSGGVPIGGGKRGSKAAARGPPQVGSKTGVGEPLGYEGLKLRLVDFPPLGRRRGKGVRGFSGAHPGTELDLVQARGCAALGMRATRARPLLEVVSVVGRHSSAAEELSRYAMTEEELEVLQMWEHKRQVQKTEWRGRLKTPRMSGGRVHPRMD